MVWTYSGDPNDNEKDKYRFLLGDTIENQPILQDAEIEYILKEHDHHYTRLYYLFDSAASFFARDIKIKVGPIEEDPRSRHWYFEKQARHYRSRLSAYGISLPKSTPVVFYKGMHDNG